ncbi:MAG: alpha/beta fold hydrolase [Pseudorhodoplanes sp.]
MSIYEPIKPSRSLQVPLRGLNYHVRVWGDERDPPLLFLHGGRDASATFQFLIDALRERWYIVAPDWRGHGQSDWTPGNYELQAYLADLDALVDRFLPNEPAVIVGHSLGGHVGTTYAGVRPDRVCRMVALDGFLVGGSAAAQTPRRVQDWLDKLSRSPRSHSYPTAEAMADRLQAANPRLARDKAEFLSRHVSRPHPGGGLTWAFDPRFYPPNGVSYVLEQWDECLRNIRAPVLTFSTGLHDAPRVSLAEIERRAGLIPRVSFIHLRDVGHNLQHEASELVARKMEPFLITGELPAREEVVVAHEEAGA